MSSRVRLAVSRGRENYEQIQELLGNELLDSRFEGMKDALQSTTPEDVERVRQMLADLNALLAAHAQDLPTCRTVRRVHGQHGEFFPENPHNVDELIDALAARAAAAQRMLNSMTPEQRAELMCLRSRRSAAAELAPSCPIWTRSCGRSGRARTGLGGRFRGTTRWGSVRGAQAMADLAELDALAEQLGQSYPGARMEDIDLEALDRQLGPEAGGGRPPAGRIRT